MKLAAHFLEKHGLCPFFQLELSLLAFENTLTHISKHSLIQLMKGSSFKGQHL